MKTQKKYFTPVGFTLAEVMIAMGIVASVMVALLGMIPLGVRSVREAANLTISGRIAQEIISNIQQSNWKDVIKDFDKGIFTFDNEGFAMTGATKGNNPSFKARVDIPDPAIVYGRTIYDKGILKKVLVEVEFTPDGVSIPPKPGKPNPNIIKYNFYVANQNKSS